MDSTIHKWLRDVEGYITRFKEMHWNSKDTAEHNFLGDSQWALSSSQDEIAEECIVTFGDIEANSIAASFITGNDIVVMCEELVSITELCQSEFASFSSLNAKFDEVVSRFKHLVYLANQAKVKA
jgi:hypothetical protein